MGDPPKIIVLPRTPTVRQWFRNNGGQGGLDILTRGHVEVHLLRRGVRQRRIGIRPTEFRHLFCRHGGQAEVDRMVRQGLVCVIRTSRGRTLYEFPDEVERQIEKGRLRKVDTTQGPRYVLSPKAEGRHD